MNDVRDSSEMHDSADDGSVPSRAEQVAWRGASVLLVLAFAVQVGLGYARPDAFFRDSLSKPTFIRALAHSLTISVARPTRDTREVPARQVALRGQTRLDSVGGPLAIPADAFPRSLPRIELIALPPPLA